MRSIFVQLSALPVQIASLLSDGTILMLLHYQGEFNVTLQCPVIVVPENANSPDVFVVSCGVLNLKSASSGAQPKDFDEISIHLSSLSVSRYACSLLTHFWVARV